MERIPRIDGNDLALNQPAGIGFLACDMQGDSYRFAIVNRPLECIEATYVREIRGVGIDYSTCVNYLRAKNSRRAD